MRKLATSDEGLSSLANIYIIAMNPGDTFDELKEMSDGHPDWIYALPTDTSTLGEIIGLTRSTKILVGTDNVVLGRYKMGEWKLTQWIKIFRNAS